MTDMLEDVIEEQMQSLIADWGVGVVRIDRKYRITVINAEAIRIDGRSISELIGKTFWEAWPTAVGDRAGVAVRQAMDERVGSTVTLYPLERPDGLTVWMDFRVHPWGEGVAIFTHDMTNHHTLEVGLTDMERCYALASRATADVMYDWDLIKDKIWFSEAGATTLGVPSMLENALSWREKRLHPNDRGRALSTVSTAMTSGAAHWSDEYRMLVGDGHYACIHERGFITHDDNAKPVRAIGALSDVTTIRQAQEQVRQLQNELIHISRLSAMGTMASVMAHELNQPLAAVGTYLAGTENLLKGAETPNVGTVLDGIARARESSTRAGEIMRRMRMMTRKSEPVREAVNVLKAVKDAAAMVFVGRDDQHRAMRIEVPENLVVHADLIQLEQVLINLIRNALEANDEAGGDEIAISALIHGQDQVEIVVKDRGPGVSAGIWEKLFDFFATTKMNGMGIGLPISRTIIESYGGEIKFDNRADGGAVFSIVMPISLISAES